MEMTISLVGKLIEVKEFGIHPVVDEPNAINNGFRIFNGYGVRHERS
jgi:hypothetical protein